jgi:hypothetical protein
VSWVQIPLRQWWIAQLVEQQKLLSSFAHSFHKRKIKCRRTALLRLLIGWTRVQVPPYASRVISNAFVAQWLEHQCRCSSFALFFLTGCVSVGRLPALDAGGRWFESSHPDNRLRRYRLNGKSPGYEPEDYRFESFYLL